MRGFEPPYAEARLENGRQGRTRTYVVSNVADLQSAAFAAQRHSTKIVLLEKRFGTHRPRQSLAGGAKSSTMLSSMARLLLLSYIVMCCWQSLNVSNDLIFCQYSMKWQMIRSNPPNLLIREQ